LFLGIDELLPLKSKTKSYFAIIVQEDTIGYLCSKYHSQS